MTPEAFAILELGRTIADDMDVAPTCQAFTNRINGYACLNDVEKNLASEVLSSGNHFSIIEKYVQAEGGDKNVYKDMVGMISKKRRAGYRSRKKTL